jgi:hypothetical protein
MNNNKIKSIFRIGPHSIDIISIIFGCMLGNAYSEKGRIGTRF